MRILGFLRWLREKYPKIIVRAKEDVAVATDIDATAPNPNGVEFDNFYIDMDCLICASIDPEERDPNAESPTPIDDIFNKVFQYVDRYFEIVRPRKLLFLAMSGVAPRAKINQWRANHFLSARKDEIVQEKKKKLLEKYEKQGKKVLLPQTEGMFEGPVILAPGTEFMFKMSKALQGYIEMRIRENAAWRDIKVIISDSNVPGEGKQKIMSFIRSQRTLPGYDPNTRHCWFGTGADPILLALATHEVHFFLLWEEVRPPFSTPKTISSTQNGEDLLNDMSDDSKGSIELDDKAHQNLESYTVSPAKQTSTHLVFLLISVLREYLELDLQLSRFPDGFKYDFEGVIDDFIFMCFFLDHNTILPQMPTLYVEEGAIELLMAVYKSEFKNLGGYLVDAHLINAPDTTYVDLKRVERFILSIGSHEEQIFKKRYRMKQRKIRSALFEIANSLDEKAKIEEDMVSLPAMNLSTEQRDALQDTKQFEDDLKSISHNRSEAFRIRSYCFHDKVNFGYFGWKERYYEDKFSACSMEEMETTRRAIIKAYAEGLCWLLQYYFSGVPSWSWFYPYHYAPCASDFRGLSQVKVEFDMGSPVAPFDELMATLHPREACVLPESYRSLMTDPCSEIYHFYPKEFVVDFDGKRDELQGVCHLPFIDEEMLLTATSKAAEKIDSFEAQRNSVTVNKLFLRASSTFGSQIRSLFSDDGERSPSGRVQVNLSGPDAIAGFMHVSSVFDDVVMCLDYEFPIPKEVIQRPIAGVVFTGRSVYESDIPDWVMWHEHNRHNRVSTQDRYRKTNLSEDNMLFKPGSSGCIPVESRTRGNSSSLPSLVGDSSTCKSDSSALHAYIPPHLRNRNAIPSSSGATSPTCSQQRGGSSS